MFAKRRYAICLLRGRRPRSDIGAKPQSGVRQIPAEDDRSPLRQAPSNFPERVRLRQCPSRPWEEPEMPTFLMLTNLTAEGVRTLKNHPGRIAEVNQEVEQMGVKVVSQYATLGQYDFVTVVEAPDEQTMAKVSVELGSRGTMTSQTLAAIPAESLASSL